MRRVTVPAVVRRARGAWAPSASARSWAPDAAAARRGPGEQRAGSWTAGRTTSRRTAPMSKAEMEMGPVGALTVASPAPWAASGTARSAAPWTEPAAVTSPGAQASRTRAPAGCSADSVDRPAATAARGLRPAAADAAGPPPPAAARTRRTSVRPPGWWCHSADRRSALRHPRCAASPRRGGS